MPRDSCDAEPPLDVTAPSDYWGHEVPPAYQRHLETHPLLPRDVLAELNLGLHENAQAGLAFRHELQRGRAAIQLHDSLTSEQHVLADRSRQAERTMVELNARIVRWAVHGFLSNQAEKSVAIKNILATRRLKELDGPSVSPEDAWQVGFYALERSVRTWDPEKTAFNTHAMIRVGSAIADLRRATFTISPNRRELRDLTAGEVCSLFGWSLGQAEFPQKLSVRTVADLSADEDALCEQIPDFAARIATVDDTDHVEEHDVRQWLKILDPHTRQVIEAHLGFDRERGLPLRELATDLSANRQAIANTLSRGFGQIRRAMGVGEHLLQDTATEEIPPLEPFSFRWQEMPRSYRDWMNDYLLRLCAHARRHSSPSYDHFLAGEGLNPSPRAVYLIIHEVSGIDFIDGKRFIVDKEPVRVQLTNAGVAAVLRKALVRRRYGENLEAYVQNLLIHRNTSKVDPPET